MLIGITGTPGTGKSSVAEELRRRGIAVLDLKTTVEPYIVGVEDDSSVVDTEVWAKAMAESGLDGYVEGSLAHYLPCDKLIILRCRPDVLLERLLPRGYSEDKVNENVDAEALDVILIEAVELSDPEKIFEIDTTNTDIHKTADLIQAFAEDKLPAAFGSIDWSEYVMSL
ncbi:MAG TPA: adenylate kinase family protein [Methanocorpusculum sp.]|nr:adenylate kinase family protein [Methanocorpusculum sp.]